jgi:hypothetical protein
MFSLFLLFCMRYKIFWGFLGLGVLSAPVVISASSILQCPVQYQKITPQDCGETHHYMQIHVENRMGVINDYFRKNTLTGMHQDETNHPEVINQKSTDAQSQYYFCLQQLCDESANTCEKANPEMGSHSGFGQRSWCREKAEALVHLKAQEMTYVSVQNQARKERNLFEEKHKAISARFRKYLHTYLIDLVNQVDRFESRVNYFIQNPVRE